MGVRPSRSRNDGSDNSAISRRRFDALVREHHASVDAHVQVVYPSAHADAVVNAAFTSLWLRLDQVPDEAVRAWLRAAVRLEVLNASRQQRRWTALGDRVARLDRSIVSPRADVDGRIDFAIVMRAMATLRQIDRDVLMMHAVEELTTNELATILDVDPVAAKKQLSRARSRLRRAMDELDPADEVGRSASDGAGDREGP
ncbi:MAG: hypothetical protein RLZZ623_525 [Actinomycetota bacterium]